MELFATEGPQVGPGHPGRGQAWGGGRRGAGAGVGTVGQKADLILVEAQIGHVLIVAVLFHQILDERKGVGGQLGWGGLSRAVGSSPPEPGLGSRHGLRAAWWPCLCGPEGKGGSCRGRDGETQAQGAGSGCIAGAHRTSPGPRGRVEGPRGGAYRVMMPVPAQVLHGSPVAGARCPGLGEVEGMSAISSRGYTALTPWGTSGQSTGPWLNGR